MSDLTAVADAIRSNDRFLLVTHENPDGDALGSIRAMKLSPSHASPKMPITATTPARSVAVLGTSSTGTFVASSMSAATDSITISITTGIARALF